MIRFERGVPVNPPGSSSTLSREDVWRGLVLKAENALPFVPSITHCEVVEREGPNQLVREIELNGERMRERVTFDPHRSVTFTRLSGSVMGTIKNVIDEDANGDLALRFAFELTLNGAAAGSAEEAAYAAKMENAYLAAVDATLGAIRKMKEAS